MDLTPNQKERLSLSVRIVLAIVGGGLLISCFIFTFLVNLLAVAVFTFMVFLIGILIGMYNTEIHYAIISGLLAVFAGFIFLFGIIALATTLYGAWSLLDIVIMIAVDISVRLFMLQLLAILPGVVVGRIIGPEWYEPTVKHKLKIGTDNSVINESE
ncbi:MAG: hypothetical protein ACXACH_07190 [Candidatus Hermodarchaeia archaeon]|jgi:hypothetical protein